MMRKISRKLLRKNFIKSKSAIKMYILIAVFALQNSVVFAATTGTSRFPWRTMLESILSEFTGWLPLTLGAIAIAVTGILMAFGFGGQMLKTGFQVIIGVTIAIAAVTIIQMIAGDAGGLLFR